MSIYIDEQGHLITDADLEELHSFAKDIGMRREWFQNKASKHPHPHYDVFSPRLRAAAIKAGAIEITSRETVAILRLLEASVNQIDYAEQIEIIREALSKLRVGVMSSEYNLQDQIGQALTAADITFEKEYMLGPCNRADFFTAAGVVIEAKKGKPNRTTVLSQIERYAEFPNVNAVVLVVETSLKFPIRETNGKPCQVISLQKLWGIAI